MWHDWWESEVEKFLVQLSQLRSNNKISNANGRIFCSPQGTGKIEEINCAPVEEHMHVGVNYSCTCADKECRPVHPTYVTYGYHSVWTSRLSAARDYYSRSVDFSRKNSKFL